LIEFDGQGLCKKDLTVHLYLVQYNLNE